MSSALIEHARFVDRTAVGRALGERLRERGYDRPVVLALPRGGVPVGSEIARALGAPLDLVLVRKIGVPDHEEVALCAVMDGERPEVVINETVRRALDIEDDRIARLEGQALREIERRRALYLGDRPPVALEGATAILVDDGIATGATMRVALRSIRSREPARIVVAVGVAPPAVVGGLRTEVDDMVCLLEPDPFHAVGLYYENFDPVPDAEVRALLDAS